MLDNTPPPRNNLLVDILNDPRRQQFSDAGVSAEAKAIIYNFLTRLRYQVPHITFSLKLRAEISAEIVSWDAKLSPKYIEGLVEVSCIVAQSAYTHISYEHQHIVARYAAHTIYIDDLGCRDLEAVAQFGRRLVAHEKFGDASMERLAVLLRDMEAFYPRLTCDLITVATLNFMAGIHNELISKERGGVPGAISFPWYMRQKTGIGSAFVLFNFVKDWRDPADNIHLQLLPDIEFYTNTMNDVLSFYKESLVGETNNFIHLRAAAERKDPLTVLHEVAEETLETIYRVDALTASDAQLSQICRSYLGGYTEFHLRVARYRLGELNM
ncbi:terpenoid synthase [Trametes gibbosa]|nr:terpenoid synthase [Trametes gibbosa]